MGKAGAMAPVTPEQPSFAPAVVPTDVSPAAEEPSAAPSSSAAAVPAKAAHPLLGIRFFSMLHQHGLYSLSQEEVDELFEMVRPGCGGVLDVSELQASFAELGATGASAAAERFLKNVFLLVDTSEDSSRITSAQLLQAIRLSSSEVAADLASRMDYVPGKELSPFRGQQRTIKRADLLRYLRDRTLLAQRCLWLPFYMCFFVLVLSLALEHLGQKPAYQLALATGKELLPPGFERGYPGSLWSWLDGRLEAHELARFSSILGGIRVKKLGADEDELAPSVLCAHNVLDRLALALSGGQAADEPKLCKDASAIAADPGANDTQWLLWPLQKQDSRNVASVATVRAWWTNATDPGGTLGGSYAVAVDGPERVEVRMLAQNSMLKHFVLCRLVFSMPSTGQANVANHTVAFRYDPAWRTGSDDRIALRILDVVFIVMYSGLALWRIWRLMSNSYWLGCRGGLKSQVAFGELADFIIVASAVGGTITFCYCNKLTDGLIRLSDRLPAFSLTGGGSTWEEYTLSLEAALEQAALVSRATQNLHWLTLVVTFGSCFQLLRCLSVCHRFNVVLGTVMMAARELLGLFFIFAVTLLSFALVGHVAFGTWCDLFSTKGDAAYTTFFLAFGFALDDYNEELLVGTGGTLAAIWLALLAMTFPLLLLGVVFSAMFDAHMEATADTGRGSTKSCIDEFCSVFSERLKECGCCRRRPTTRWTERFLLDVFSRQRETGGDVAELSVETLFEELERLLPKVGVSDDDKLQLQAIFDKASEAQAAHCLACCSDSARLQIWPMAAGNIGPNGTTPLTGAVRLCSRVDANVRELASLIQGVEARVQHRDEERTGMLAALAKARKAPSVDQTEVALHLVQPDRDLEVEDIEDEFVDAVPPPPPPLREPIEPEPPAHRPWSSTTDTVPAAMATASSGFDAPGTTASTAFNAQAAEAVAAAALAVERAERAAAAEAALDALVEENLHKASEAQAVRHRELGESMEQLAQNLEPLLQASRTAKGVHSANTVPPDRLSRLEARVRQLSTRLTPILDADAFLAQPGVLSVPKGW